MQPAERRWDHWSQQPFLSFTQALSSPSAVLTINQMGFGWTQQNCTFLPVHQHIRQWDGQAVLHPSVTCYSSLDLKKTWILVLSGIHCSSIIIVSDPQKLNADHSYVKLPFNTRDWLEIRLQVTCITCNCSLFMPFTTHDTALFANNSFYTFLQHFLCHLQRMMQHLCWHAPESGVLSYNSSCQGKQCQSMFCRSSRFARQCNGKCFSSGSPPLKL